MYVGRLVPEKGLTVLMEALALLRSLEWSLHVAGEGPQREELQRFVRQKGLSERVTWCGALEGPALQAQYQQAAVVVMPSLIPESFGLVGLEAMAHAKPVVGFASGGMRDWLRDQVNGRVAQWGNAESLAAAVDELLGDESLAQRLGQQGRQLADLEYGAERHLQGLMALLQQRVQAQPPQVRGDKNRKSDGSTKSDQSHASQESHANHPGLKSDHFAAERPLKP